jgi:hypothetical protein
MITATASQYVLNALLALLEGKSVFTAHDVSVAARAKTNADGSDEFIDHEEVRNIVHTEYSTGEFPDEYNKEEFLALTNGHTAICYYPDGKTAEDHPMAVQGQTAITQQTSTTSPAQAVSQSAAPKAKLGGKTKDGDGFIVNVTCDGRINIPKELKQQVTPDGGSYDVQFQGTILYKKPIGSEDRLVLKKSDLKGGEKFRIGVDVSSNTITVEQV